MPSRDTTDHGRGPSAAWRAAATLVAVTGPLAVGLLRVRLPYTAVDDPAAMAQAVAGDPAAMSWVVWMGYVATLTLVPATILAATRPLRLRPVLTGVAVVLAVAGYASLGVLVAADLLLEAVVAAGLDAATAGRVLESAHPVATIGVAVFVPGHLLGTILLGVALWRTRTGPRWAAAATVASQPLHLVSAVVLLSPALDLTAWLLTATGFGLATWSGLGEPRPADDSTRVSASRLGWAGLQRPGRAGA